MGWEGWLTGALVLGMLGAMASGRIGADLVMFGTVVVLLGTGVLDPREAIAGFSNTGLVTVAMLYVVATGLQQTGAMAVLTARMLGRPGGTLEAQARIALPVAGLSAFVNNTPIVAMFLPVLRDLSRRTGISASRLFLPLSYAAILGGTCSLIGTSTNLVTQGLILEQIGMDPQSGLRPFGMWTISLVGVPLAIVGIAYILLFGRRLLPDRPDVLAAGDASRHYTTAMLVSPTSPIVGRTIEQAGLRHLPGLFLSRIEREGETIVAAGPDEVLLGGDTLVFVGVVDSVVDLQKIKGLSPVADGAGQEDYRPRLRHIEAVISPSSPLVNRTVRDAGIRTRYGAVVIAVHRHGHRLGGKIGDITLRGGDTLLLEAAPGFAARYRHSSEFNLVSELDGAASLRHERAPVAIGILAGMVLAMNFVAEERIMVVAMAAAVLMVLLRCCTGPQARAGIDWRVLVVIGSSFGVARAMSKTGVADAVAGSVAIWAGDMGPWALLAAVYALTLVFTSLISNNAAAALMFPVALGVAQAGDLNFMPFAICITVAASCEFMTPIGYQTNLMVMGPGGYRWGDYLRFGTPLSILCGVVCVGLAPLLYGPFNGG